MKYRKGRLTKVAHFLGSIIAVSSIERHFLLGMLKVAACEVLNRRAVMNNYFNTINKMMQATQTSLERISANSPFFNHRDIDWINHSLITSQLNMSSI